MPNVLGPVSRIGISSSERTVAELLKQQGYATMCVGKWHLGDQPEFLPTRHGFDHYVGLPYSNDMGGPAGRATAARRFRCCATERVIEAPVRQDKLVELYTEEAVKFITANKDRPFFLYLPHTAVHVPIHPGKAFQGKSANGRYGDWVEEVDWSTGRVLDTLRSLKLDSRTLVLFTSDNGPWRSQGKDGGVAGPLRGGKASTWEGGVREPTIAWWPGKIPAGTACDAMMSEMDVLPTLVKLAGGAVPGDRVIDGQDIWPLLSGRSKQSPHEALFYFKGNRLEAVRSGPWKLAIVRADRKRHRQGEAAFDQSPSRRSSSTWTRTSARRPTWPPSTRTWSSGSRATSDRWIADLGVTGRGPGVRPSGVVDQPQPLLLRNAMEYD